jgi:hypothetical protein
LAHPGKHFQRYVRRGQFVVTPRPAPQTIVEADISREPDDLPPPLAKREPQTVRVDLFSVEIEGRLAEGTTFGYWTFNGKVRDRLSGYALAIPSTFTSRTLPIVR